MWFETEEEFFAAASRCAALYFLPERRVWFREKSLQPASGGADCQSALYRVIQRGSEREILADNTGGALYDAAIVLSRYLAAREADGMQGKTVLVCLYPEPLLRRPPTCTGLTPRLRPAGARLWTGAGLHGVSAPRRLVRLRMRYGRRAIHSESCRGESGPHS